jgi:hypothetical protein
VEYYALLTGLTIAIGGLAALLWRRTKSLAILGGIAFFYYWSLFGAWSLIYDLRGGDSGMHYDYLFDRMFPVDLDADYFWALAYFGIFIITIELVLLWRLRDSPLPAPLDERRLIRISHSKLLLICGLAGFISYELIQESLVYAWNTNSSVYLVTRGETDYDVISLFTLHATLNRLALFPLVIGLATLASERNARMMTGNSGPLTLPAYLVVLGAMFSFCFILGNKNELFVALVIGVLFYLANHTQPRKVMLACIGGAALAGVAIIDFFRGTSLNDLHSAMSTEAVSNALGYVATSNEAFASHMSMYGCLHYDIPLTYGSSFISFVASVVPRFLWAERPPDIYVHYAMNVQAFDRQGYSIHHAAGWYLNFGLVGIIAGALILGWVWSSLFLGLKRLNDVHSRVGRVFFSFAALSFSAYLPTIIRAGPEVYKGVIIDAFAVPLLALLLSIERAPLRRPATNRVQKAARLKPQCADV